MQNLRRRRRRARLSVESLEQRQLLAGLFGAGAEGESGSADVAIRPTLRDLDGATLESIGAGQEFFLDVEVQDLRAAPITGVFAAYTDVVFDPRLAAVPADDPFGIDIQFGQDYENGQSLDAVSHVQLDELGAFQSSLTPLGRHPLTLARVRMHADGVTSHDDVFRAVLEDTQHNVLDVLANDQIVDTQVTVRTNPADNLPFHEVLLFDPTSPVPQDRIQYGQVTVPLKDASSLRIVRVSDPNQGGTVSISDDGRHLFYTPAANFSGQEIFTYALSSGDTAQAMVLVQPQDDPPTARDDVFDLPHGQDTTITGQEGVLSNDRDPDGDPLQVELLQPPEHGTLDLSANGGFRYEPAAGYRGVDSFRYRVLDDDGLVDTAHVTLNVAPPTVGFGLEAVNEDGAVITQVAAGERFHLITKVQDLRNLSHTGVYAAYVDVAFDSNLAQVIPNPDGSLQTAQGGYENGTAPTLSNDVLHNVGGFQDSVAPIGSDEIRFASVAFEARGSAPQDDHFTGIQEDQATITLDVLANDDQADAAVQFTVTATSESPRFDVLLHQPGISVSPSDMLLDALTLPVAPAERFISAVGKPSSGSSTNIAADGRSIAYRPAADFAGVEQFTYTLSDGQIATVTVEVEGSNDRPRGTDDVYHVRENRPLQISAADGVAANDSDPDGDDFIVMLDRLPQLGAVSLNQDGSFRYVPPANTAGGDTFAYRVLDATSQSEPIEVQLVFDPPPVQIALSTRAEDGTELPAITAGDTFWLAAELTDLRTTTIPGFYAGYLDVGFSAELSTPRPADNDLGFEIEFGAGFELGQSGQLGDDQLVGVGAFQSGLEPPAGPQSTVWQIPFLSQGPRAFDDQFAASASSLMNRYDLLANELNAAWYVSFEPGAPADRPAKDVLLYHPPSAVEPVDIRYVGAELLVANPDTLSVEAIVVPPQHGSIQLNDDGRHVDYTPRTGFVGQDRFQYSIVDHLQRRVTATVTIDVTASWQNARNHLDVNSDAVVAPSDAILVINDLNQLGARRLDTQVEGPPFIDVTGDEAVSPADVLMVLNYLNVPSEPGNQVEGESITWWIHRGGPTSLPPLAADVDADTTAARTYEVQAAFDDFYTRIGWDQSLSDDRSRSHDGVAETDDDREDGLDLQLED